MRGASASPIARTSPRARGQRRRSGPSRDRRAPRARAPTASSATASATAGAVTPARSVSSTARGPTGSAARPRAGSPREIPRERASATSSRSPCVEPATGPPAARCGELLPRRSRQEAMGHGRRDPTGSPLPPGEARQKPPAGRLDLSGGSLRALEARSASRATRRRRSSRKHVDRCLRAAAEALRRAPAATLAASREGNPEVRLPRSGEHARPSDPVRTRQVTWPSPASSTATSTSSLSIVTHAVTRTRPMDSDASDRHPCRLTPLDTERVDVGRDRRNPPTAPRSRSARRRAPGRSRRAPRGVATHRRRPEARGRSMAPPRDAAPAPPRAPRRLRWLLGELYHPRRVPEHLDRLDPRDLVEEPAARRVHEQAVTLELEAPEHLDAVLRIQRTERVTLEKGLDRRGASDRGAPPRRHRARPRDP